MIPLKDDVPKVRVRFPIFMLLLLISNIIVFIYEMSLSRSALNRLINNYGAIPLLITRGENLYTLFSAMFLHGGFDHIIGNMLYLWIFADNVEDVLGHFWFIIMYFLAGLVGSLFHILMASGSDVPMIGASGAISGVLGNYLVFFPTARILALVPFGFFLRIIYVPAYLFLGFWILLQFIYGFASLPGIKGGGIAFFAHIGGFLIGVLWGLLFRHRAKNGERYF